MGIEPPKIIRIVAFFVAGVVLAVGSALIYSTAHGLGPSVDVVRVKAPAQGQSSKPRDAAAQRGESGSAEDARAARAEVLIEGSGAPTVAPQDSGDTDDTRATPKPQAPVAKPSPAIAQDVPVLVPPTPPDTSDTQPVNAESPLANASVPSNLLPLSPSTPAQPAPREMHAVASLRQPHVAMLLAGTNLVIRLGDTLSSERNSSGEMFRATLESPLVQNGFIVAEKGSPVVGRLLYVHHSHFPGGASELSLTVIGINTSDGQFVPVRTSPWEEKNGRGGLGHTAKQAVGTAAGVMMEAVSDMGKVARLGFGSHEDTERPNGSERKNLVLPRGSTLSFRLSAPVTLIERTRSTE